MQVVRIILVVFSGNDAGISLLLFSVCVLLNGYWFVRTDFSPESSRHSAGSCLSYAVQNFRPLFFYAFIFLERTFLSYFRFRAL